MLEHEANFAFAHMARGGVHTMEQDLTGIRRIQPGDDAQQRGLAATGRAKQGHQFAGFYVEVDSLEGAEMAEGLRDIADLDAHWISDV